MFFSIRNVKNIFLIEDLRNKLFFTFGVLAVFRFGVHVPIPGFDTVALGELMNNVTSGGFMGYLNLFSGGALQNIAIFSLGISPYINASIMIQILSMIVPELEALSKEGEYGRRKINNYTRYLAFVLSIFYSIVLLTTFEAFYGNLVLVPGWGFRLTTIMMLTAGSQLVMWLGEQINQYGIGQGSSLIIFAGIVTGLPGGILKLVGGVMGNSIDPLIAIAIVLFLLVLLGCIVFLEKGERRITVQYAKRVVGQRVYGGVSSYIPFKLNSAGVVPVIYATFMLTPFMTIINWISGKSEGSFPQIKMLASLFEYGSPAYYVIFALMIIFFSFLYTSIQYRPDDIADNLRKSGGFIPGIRPGRRTAEFIEYLLTRVGLPGSIYLASLAIFPDIALKALSSPVIFSGTGLLIAVGVALDTSAQVEAALIDRKYEGFLSKGRLKGRYGRG